MTKDYVKENGKIYEVQKIEVTIADMEYDIGIAWNHVTELQSELAAMNAVKAK